MNSNNAQYESTLSLDSLEARGKFFIIYIRLEMNIVEHIVYYKTYKYRWINNGKSPFDAEMNAV